jgi:hypothetical protein
METQHDGLTGSPPSAIVPGSFSTEDTLSPTATERLLAAGGASVYVLSKDSDLVTAIDAAAGGRVPVHVIWSFQELRRLAGAGECKVVVLDADLFDGSLRSWIEDLCALEPTLVMLVAARRFAEENLTELLSERLVYRLLRKPAEAAVTRTLLDVAVSRYLQRCGEVVASLTQAEAARVDSTAPENDIPVPRNELIALRQQAARSAPIRPPPRKPVERARTYWPAWLLPTALAATIAVAVLFGDFRALDFRGAFSDNAGASAEPSFAEPVEAEAPVVDPVVGEIEDVFLSDAPTADAQPAVGEAPLDASSEPPAAVVVPEAAVAHDAPPTAELVEGSPVSVAAVAEASLAERLPAEEPSAPAPAPTPTPTTSPELENLLATAWSRLRENALLAPQGDSARDYVELATGLAPDHPDVKAIRSLLADALAESARAAIASADIERAETLVEEAFRFDASDETLAALDLDLAVAREIASRRAHAELFELGVARIREERLIAPENDNALAYLRRLSAERPDYPGLDSAWQSLGEALARKVEESAAAGDLASAEAWLEPLAQVASPATVERVRAELAQKEAAVD